MLASQIIKLLQAEIDERGDHPVVSGLQRFGYGEPITGLKTRTSKTIENTDLTVIDLITSDDSLVADGGF